MKILILGANGQVGYELARRLDASNQLVVLSREQVDFSQDGALAAAVAQHRPDVVLNAVAYTAVDKAETEADLATRINAHAVGELALACAQNNAWLLHYSTDYVFDGSACHPYKESDPVSPLGVYGLSKLKGEQLIAQNTDKYIILRTSWVYSWRGANFVKTMLRLAGERDELGIVNDQQGCPTYAPDIADASAQIITQLGNDVSLSGVYHLTGTQPTSWYGFAREIFSRCEIEIKLNAISTEQFPTPAARPAYSILNNNKLKRIFAIELPGYADSLSDCLGRIKLD